MMLDFILDLDWKIFYYINSAWTSEWADKFFPFITDLHKTPSFRAIVIPIVLGIFVWRRGLKKGLIIFFFLLLSLGAADGIGNHGFKKNFQRPRPGDTVGLVSQVRSPYGGYSFVSNHAANMFAFATFTAVMFPASTVLVFTIAGLVGYSRIYNGVHFPTDVLAGAFIGFLGALICIFLCKLVLKRFETVEVVGS